MSIDKKVVDLASKINLARKSGRAGPGKSLHDQLGASGIEYAVIVGIVVVALVAAFAIFDVGEFFTGIFTEINTALNGDAVDPD